MRINCKRVRFPVDNARALAHTVLMNRLTTAKRTAVVAALVEGNSVRSTARMTNVSKPTILKLLSELGDACATYHDEHVRGLKCERPGAPRMRAAAERHIDHGWMENVVAGLDRNMREHHRTWNRVMLLIGIVSGVCAAYFAARVDLRALWPL